MTLVLCLYVSLVLRVCNSGVLFLCLCSEGLEDRAGACQEAHWGAPGEHHLHPSAGHREVRSQGCGQGMEFHRISSLKVKLRRTELQRRRSSPLIFNGIKQNTQLETICLFFSALRRNILAHKFRNYSGTSHGLPGLLLSALLLRGCGSPQHSWATCSEARE